MTPTWTTPDDVADRVRRRWTDGSLLRAYASGRPLASIEVPLRGPRPTEIGENLAAVRDWIALLDAGRRDDRRYTLRWTQIGGRSIGRNRIPDRAVIATFDQAWALLGVAREVRAFDDVLASTRDHPAVRRWIEARPHRALALADQMPRLISAYCWLEANRGSDQYLRQISAPAVDTKFTEQHRATLAAMLDVSSTASGFLADLGLREKPRLVRLRAAAGTGPLGSVSEVALRVADLAPLPMTVDTALIVENEITYLSVNVPDRGVVIWGHGFDVERLGRLPWLGRADVAYWGDLDTYGFAILDRLRAHLPTARSVLMDRQTLEEHADRWVTEDRPTSARLDRLTDEESAVYAGLVSDVWGDRVRLEQERIDWLWAQQRLP